MRWRGGLEKGSLVGIDDHLKGSSWLFFKKGGSVGLKQPRRTWVTGFLGKGEPSLSEWRYLVLSLDRLSVVFFGRKKNVTIWFWVIGRDMPLKMISQLTFQLEGLVKVKWWQVTSWHSDMYLTPAFLFLSPYKLDEATSQEGKTPTVSTWPSFPLSDWLDKKPPRMTSILVMNCPD